MPLMIPIAAAVAGTGVLLAYTVHRIAKRDKAKVRALRRREARAKAREKH
jgi:hypothetical protein